jgi:hypothetical protein
MYAIAPSDHFMPLKSLVAVAGTTAFFDGTTFCLFVFGRLIQLVSKRKKAGCVGDLTHQGPADIAVAEAPRH